MIPRRPRLLLASALCALAFSPAVSAAPLPPLVPSPREWAPEGETPVKFDLLKLDRLHIDSRFKKELSSAALLHGFRRREMKLGAVAPAYVNAAPASGLFLTLDETGLPPNGYRMRIGDSGIAITAQSPEGAAYAVQTLSQLTHARTPLTPGTITDHPDLPKRILLLDAGRKPVTKEELKDFIRMMSWYKFNELHLHLNDEAFGKTYSAFRIRSKTFPELAAKDVAYDARDLRELQDFAKLYAVNIMPEIDIPGHSEAFVDAWPALSFRGQPTYLDVNNPEVKVRLKKLFDEVIPLFDSTDFHIGTDEYRVKCEPSERKKLTDDFMNFANEMAAYVESKGKTCRMWYGNPPDHRVSSVKPLPSVVLDIWNIHNGVKDATYGNRIIHSNEHVTYLVPGAHYYGVNNGNVYKNWNPRKVGDFDTAGTGLLVGAKLHVWQDHGPTGYTNRETADLLLPSLQVFSERMWGNAPSGEYRDFQERAARTLPIPGAKLLERLPSGVEVFRHDRPVSLTSTSASVAIPASKGNGLDHPWTLSLEIRKTKETGKRGVILSCDLVELCSDLKMSDVVNAKGDKPGIGLVRASGGPTVKDAAPPQFFLSKDTSYSSQVLLPLNTWARLTVVAERGKTTFFLDGKKIGGTNNQIVCPLLRFGARTDASFVGEIRNVTLRTGAENPR